MKSRIIIVDEEDNIIGHKNRKLIEEQDIDRVSALWITNSKGEILLAQRAFNKTNDPGKWGPAVAGTIEEGETYDTNIIKEAKEEIGLQDIKPTAGVKVRHTGKHNYFAQWYLLHLDKSSDEFTVDRTEVNEVKWFSRTGLEQDLKDNPEKFLDGMKDWLQMS